VYQSGPSFLGYTFGTSGASVPNTGINIAWQSTEARISFSLFDHTSISNQEEAIYNRIIIRRIPSRWTSIQGGNIIVSQMHLLDVSNTTPADSGNSNVIAARDGSLTINQALIDATSPEAPIKDDIIEFLEGSSGTLNSVTVLTDSDVSTVIDIQKGSRVSIFPQNGAPGFISGTYRIRGITSESVINITEASDLALLNDIESSSDIINDGDGTCINCRNNSRLSVIGKAAPNQYIFTTSGNTSIFVNNSIVNLVNAELTGSTAEIEIKQGSKVVSNSVTFSGANKIDIGTLGNMVPPPSGSGIIDIAAFGASAVGDLSQYITV